MASVQHGAPASHTLDRAPVDFQACSPGTDSQNWPGYRLATCLGRQSGDLRGIGYVQPHQTALHSKLFKCSRRQRRCLRPSNVFVRCPLCFLPGLLLRFLHLSSNFFHFGSFFNFSPQMPSIFIFFFATGFVLFCPFASNNIFLEISYHLSGLTTNLSF